MTSSSTLEARPGPAVAGRDRSRLAECGLELHRDKTRIVYCKDDDRRGSYEHESFDFFGYTFRPRLSRNKFGEALRQLHSRRSARRAKRDAARDPPLALAPAPDKTLTTWRGCSIRSSRAGSTTTGASTARCCIRSSGASTVPGALGHAEIQAPAPPHRRARRLLGRRRRRQPGLFAHWRFVRPDGWTMGAR